MFHTYCMFSTKERLHLIRRQSIAAGRCARYIANQPEHHCKRSFEEEFVALLQKSGIDYDSRYGFGRRLSCLTALGTSGCTLPSIPLRSMLG
jgi:DNA gyrase inhibitor GyrI